ncbi:MAG: hypothetical protein ACOZCL_18155 [Bacillota bacterium]
MRFFTVTLERYYVNRSIEILYKTSIEEEAMAELIKYSDFYENEIVEGKSRVFLTTYLQD